MLKAMPGAPHFNEEAGAQSNDVTYSRTRREEKRGGNEAAVWCQPWAASGTRQSARDREGAQSTLVE